MIKDRSFGMYLLLTFVTCGIYGIYFWYKYVEDMNIVCNGDGKETQNYILVILLSLITCGIYSYVWSYGVGNRLAENAPRYGMNFSENGTTILIWNLFGALICGIGPFFAQYIMIKNLNALGYAYNQGYVNQSDADYTDM